MIATMMILPIAQPPLCKFNVSSAGLFTLFGDHSSGANGNNNYCDSDDFSHVYASFLRILM
ncbi:MAG: hypothetical protein SO072_09415 [Dysosmobacter sp.]|nr:hypothetical protein [Dysosmobacter sp.]